MRTGKAAMQILTSAIRVRAAFFMYRKTHRRQTSVYGDSSFTYGETSDGAEVTVGAGGTRLSRSGPFGAAAATGRRKDRQAGRCECRQQMRRLLEGTSRQERAAGAGGSSRLVARLGLAGKLGLRE
jgi:hypothetical protein